MFEIKKIKNYKHFAEALEKNTGFSIKIQVVNNNHYHYQINDKYDMTLGVLCVDNGEVSFAPFVTHENAQDDQYINVKHMAQFDDFIKLLSIFQNMFVVDEDV